MTEQLWILLSISSPLFGLAFIVMWWLLRKSIDAKIDILKTNEINDFKNNLAKELETTKHELKLEHAKLSIVYENQRDSFKSLIQGMYKAIEDLSQPFDEAWNRSAINIIMSFANLLPKRLFLLARRVSERLISSVESTPQQYLGTRKKIFKTKN